jgi:hypothetical protein
MNMNIRLDMDGREDSIRNCVSPDQFDFRCYQVE